MSQDLGTSLSAPLSTNSWFCHEKPEENVFSQAVSALYVDSKYLQIGWLLQVIFKIWVLIFRVWRVDKICKFKSEEHSKKLSSCKEAKAWSSWKCYLLRRTVNVSSHFSTTYCQSFTNMKVSGLHLVHVSARWLGVGGEEARSRELSI